MRPDSDVRPSAGISVSLIAFPFFLICVRAIERIMAEEEEVLIEVEAVQAVYGDDCRVLSKFPPHLHLHLKPRTADVSCEQVYFTSFFFPLDLIV